MDKEIKKTRTIRLTDSEMKQLKIIADKDNRTTAGLIRKVLIDFLNKYKEENNA